MMVRIDPQCKHKGKPKNVGGRKHWGRGRVMDVQGKYAMVLPLGGHNSPEKIDPKYLKDWKAGNHK
jgi:hypothetical protein